MKAIAREHGGGEFQWATRTEERNRLWQARHDAFYASMALRPGAAGIVTDVCLPISRLAEGIAAVQQDIKAGRPARADGRPRRRRQLPPDLPGRPRRSRGGRARQGGQPAHGRARARGWAAPAPASTASATARSAISRPSTAPARSLVMRKLKQALDPAQPDEPRQDRGALSAVPSRPAPAGSAAAADRAADDRPDRAAAGGRRAGGPGVLDRAALAHRDPARDRARRPGRRARAAAQDRAARGHPRGRAARSAGALRAGGGAGQCGGARSGPAAGRLRRSAADQDRVRAARGDRAGARARCARRTASMRCSATTTGRSAARAWRGRSARPGSRCWTTPCGGCGAPAGTAGSSASAMRASAPTGWRRRSRRSPTRRRSLVMTHSPDIFPEVPARVALCVAGHTHGGQVRLPLARRAVRAVALRPALRLWPHGRGGAASGGLARGRPQRAAGALPVPARDRADHAALRPPD